jgi:hypothetical protein
MCSRHTREKNSLKLMPFPPVYVHRPFGKRVILFIANRNLFNIDRSTEGMPGEDAATSAGKR